MPSPTTSRSNETSAAVGIMLAAALDLADRGYRVFPLKPGKKEPLIPKRAGGSGCLDATTDAQMVRSWWTGSPAANVGVATGDGLLVVDIDGDAAAFEFTRLVNESGETWPIRTPTVLSGKGGMRVHYYLATPGLVLGCSAGKVCKNVDTRGDGGYVVAPPSVHPDSRAPYRWIVSPDEEAPAPAPEWIVDLLLHDPGEHFGERAPFKTAEATSAVGARILDEECARIEAAPDGERNHTAFARSAAVGNLVAGGVIVAADATDRLIRAAETAGLPSFEARTVVINGLTRGFSTPRAVGRR
jgi:Bifunctional DNA primase/polymerase, N-terminal